MSVRNQVNLCTIRSGAIVVQTIQYHPGIGTSYTYHRHMAKVLPTDCAHLAGLLLVRFRPKKSFAREVTRSNHGESPEPINKGWITILHAFALLNC